MFNKSSLLLTPGALSVAETEQLLAATRFSRPEEARRRIVELPTDEASRQALAECLPALLVALSDVATPDGSLVNFERFVQSVDDRSELFAYLASNPRAVEILVKLFVGSQFLTEILLRNPGYLDKLTQHKRLADMKSREQFYAEALDSTAALPTVAAKLDAIRRYQHWELLRIGACDSFGLFDLKSATVQLSLLADSLVQCCLVLFAEELGLSLDGFVVIAFGKLGGEELNYSSDIDLVFLVEKDASKFWQLGQKLIKALTEATGEGFLYRVDMRLRPWGRSGALVNTVDAHVQYLRKDGRQWEKQALLKARPIAGDLALGTEFLKRARPLMLSTSVDVVRDNVRQMKARIEADLEKQGRGWGEVKSGAGSIRDVEFTTQFLQLAHGAEHPHVLSFNTLDALVRLADLSLIQADEYRQLSTGYVFLRTVEHALQLMHHKQTHSLPGDERELAWLARRLDYPNAREFLAHYERHCATIRAVFVKYIEQTTPAPGVLTPDSGRLPGHLAHMDRSYTQVFSEDEIARHAEMLERLSPQRLVEVEARRSGGPVAPDHEASGKHNDGTWTVTVIGYDLPGDLSMICGLLFVHGFDILAGHAFTEEQMVPRGPSAKNDTRGRRLGRKFVDVFRVRPTADVAPDVWLRYRDDLAALMREVESGGRRKAQGQLAKRVAGAVKVSSEAPTTLFPVDIDIDVTSSEQYTVLHIRSEDTLGFLYELANALTAAGIDISRVTVSSVGSQVFDTLHVTDDKGAKITDPDRLRQLRATVVLIKHFTHLLPRSPNPEAALLHFRDFLESAFQRPDWLDELASLNQPKVLGAFAKLLGASDFLWEDFLRLQHENLFPVIRDVDSLARRKPRPVLIAELNALLAEATDPESRRAALNAYKDREMFRVDMRHILGHVTEFGEFSEELTDLAEVVVNGAVGICRPELEARYGRPLLTDSTPCRLGLCALGKCGGRELGFASDIELMFVYEGEGRTTGPESITCTEFFVKLVETFRGAITARREGIFQVDLRLRPYGRAGSLAVSADAFRNYFGPDGAAWPYERQALVKLRPIGGDADFGEELVTLRDALIYTGDAFDVAAMRAMREKQVVQLVRAGTVNAKLSPGGLVDCEYLVQGLQMRHGGHLPALRTTNTLDAMQALRDAGLLSSVDYNELSEAYIFLRRVIDALRVVRGHAKDLTVPAADSEEFVFLSRRLGYGNDPTRLQKSIDRATECIREAGRMLTD